MKHSTPAATAAQKRRFLRFQDIGCIACRKLGFRDVPAQAHHLLDGGRRRGHDATIPLCPWHHQGQPPEAFTMLQAIHLLGPSLALSSRLFREKFGSDDELLAETDRLIAEAEARAA